MVSLKLKLCMIKLGRYTCRYTIITYNVMNAIMKHMYSHINLLYGYRQAYTCNLLDDCCELERRDDKLFTKFAGLDSVHLRVGHKHIYKRLTSKQVQAKKGKQQVNISMGHVHVYF